MLRIRSKHIIIYQYFGYFWRGYRLYHKTSFNVNHETQNDIVLINNITKNLFAIYTRCLKVLLDEIKISTQI